MTDPDPRGDSNGSTRTPVARFAPTVSADVLRVRAPGVRWLSTGWGGGLRTADAAYNVSVPDGWERTDLDAYANERRREAGFEDRGPALLTGVSMAHARGARSGCVVAYATAGVSNPAALPVDAADGSTGATERSDAAGVPTAEADSIDANRRESDESPDGDADAPAGTVNLVVGTTRALDDAALANLLAVAVEAKAATLLAVTGFPGTTSDAVVTGCDPDGDRATFTGSATSTGADARACVREAVLASLRSRYADRDPPATVPEAKYGVTTTRRADVFELD